MFLVNQLIGFGGYQSDVTPAAVELTDSPVSTSDLTAYTFAGAALGAASGDRVIIVGVGGGAQTRTVSTLTVAGVSATFIVRAAGANETAELWYAAVPTGTTGDVVVTWSGAQDGCGAAVWKMTGATAAPHASGSDNDSDPGSVSINIPASGVAVGYVFQRNNTSTYTWANLTEDVDETVEASTFYHSGASAEFAAQQTGLAISADADSAGVRVPMLVVASWGP
jgi:hypothetical protein